MPQPPRTDSVRLFLALWPDPAGVDRLRAWSDGWVWPAGAVPEPPERWHLTLHFIGPVPAARLPGLERGLCVPMAPFEIAFGRVERWPRGLVVLAPLAVPEALRQLHADLGLALQRQGLAPEARAFRPHLTLARRAAGAVAPASAVSVRWRAGGYTLVRSQRGYQVLARYG